MEIDAGGEVPQYKVVQVPVVKATRKDHSDVHYLYKLHKALVLLAGPANLSGLTEAQIIEYHTAIVRSMVESSLTHWYDNYDSELDDTLPEDLLLSSEGYEPPADKSIFDLEEEERLYKQFLEENDALVLWQAPTKRKNVPADHFLDPKNKKYPYKNPDGTVSCGGLKAAIQAAGGARGAPKRPQIQAKAKKLYKKYCQKKKAESVCVGTLTKI